MENNLFEKIFDTIPIGLFIVDRHNIIYAWNKWLSINTPYTAQEAINKNFKALFPDSVSSRFEWALEQVLKYGYPQILSNVLNKYIIPIPIDKPIYRDLTMMQQEAEILPVEYGNQKMALVVIQNVTPKIHLQNTLMSIAAKFEKNSLVDTLTNLFNRRYLYKHLEIELATARRENYNVVCCLYDIDYFKQINDELGHNGGDEVLVAFAKFAKSNLRPSDYLFRYGGEEFISITSRISIENAILLPKRITYELIEILRSGSIPRAITCSVGVSYWRPSDPLTTPEKMIQKADIELYKAKKIFGRNCIVMDGKKLLPP